MRMSDDRRLRINASKSISDVQQGDYVHRALGSRRPGLVEEVHDDGFAWVAWSENRRDYLPLSLLRKIPPCGHDLDARRP